MPSLCLPSKPDLDHLKGQARTLQRQVRSGDAEALRTVRELNPPTLTDQSAFRLSDAQLVLARCYGFPSWAALRRRLAVVTEHGRSPHLVPLGDDDGPEDRADRMVRLGCLVYGGDDLDRHAEAGAMLAASPELADKDIWTAAAAGNFAHVRRLLGDDPSLINRPGGPFEWAPLLYVAYSRIHVDGPQSSPLRTAAILLEAGADPDAGYLWDGTYPFTALTGALGGGEDKGNQPPHRDAVALARMLLEAGADPNDSQALYNRQFDPDDSHLRLLIEFGLGKGRGGPWHARLNSSRGAPAQLLEDQLSVAAAQNRPEWARLALTAGASADGKGTAHPIFKGRTPYELAVHRGNREWWTSCWRRGPPRRFSTLSTSSWPPAWRCSSTRWSGSPRRALASPLRRWPAGPTPSPTQPSWAVPSWSTCSWGWASTSMSSAARRRCTRPLTTATSPSCARSSSWAPTPTAKIEASRPRPWPGPSTPTRTP